MSYTNPYAQTYKPPVATAYHPPSPGGGGKSMPGMGTGMTPQGGGLYATGGGVSPTMQQILDAIKGQPLPYDTTALLNQMLALYQGAAGSQQQNYQGMLNVQQNNQGLLDLQGQLNALYGQDIGASQHQQMLDLNRPVQHTNSMQYLVGY